MVRHPYGVLPLGNIFSESARDLIDRRQPGLGSLSVLPDMLIVRILDAILSHTSPRHAASALCNFSAASTVAFAFAADEDLWRRLAFQMFSTEQIAEAPFTSSWRCTFLKLISGGKVQRQRTSTEWQSHFYSDVLFHKWLCLTSQVRLEWLRHSDVKRISCKKVSAAQFRADFEVPNEPVIVTDLVTEWPAFKSWSSDSLMRRYGDVKFHAGGFEFSLKHYFAYCNAVEGHDDQPLYIFDKHFASKAPDLVDDYIVPEYFAEDLFKVLGEQRPDYRWLIIGPARSGSSFHKDPNSTSAWNAVVRGRKKWVMFPPEVVPPGVYPSGDEGDVTAPISITEWFLNFYNRDTIVKSGAVECLVNEGEVIFVPMGWWHCVLNVETSVAITQNYVGSCNLASVSEWVQTRPRQISGCRTPEQAKYISDNFTELVRRACPELGKRPVCRTRDREPYCSTGVGLEKKRKVALWDTLQSNFASSSGEMQSAEPAEGARKPETPAGFAFGF